MRLFFLILFSLFTGIITTISAQDSNPKVTNFDVALSLYKAGQYTSARLLFDKIKINSDSEEMRSDCVYYQAMCAVREYQPNAASLLQRFVIDYPTSTRVNQAYSEMGQFYFQQEKYDQALLWYDKVDNTYLDASYNERIYFQKGYSFFRLKNKKEAAINFNKVINTVKYASQAKYYIGFMAYEGDDYTKANQYFEAVSSDGKYKDKLSYVQSDMYFKSGNFLKAIESGQQALTKANDAEKSELNKIVGESYFNLTEYSKAIPYLIGYKGKNGKWGNNDFYQLGYAYYKQNDYEKAILQFNKIIGGSDVIAQNGYYHLGQSYLQTNRKQEALNVFKNASEMEFDSLLQEESALNYALLSYEIGNSYEDLSTILTRFLVRYPENPRKNEIEKLLLDSYISAKNYQEAFKILERKKDIENSFIYQKVLFYNGLQLFSQAKYKDALFYFEKAVNQNKDTVITARAVFWTGETHFVLDDFRNAELAYKQFANLEGASTVLEFKNFNYNIGYVYFKLKEYEKAAIYFKNQTEKAEDSPQKGDAYLRLGDCLFAGSKYWLAMEAYGKVVDKKGKDADYAYFQKAICYGFISKNESKIQRLNLFLQLYPKSEYQDDALFELGNAYVTANNTDLAIKTYDRLIAEFPKSLFVSKAILKQGLVYYNSDKDDMALERFKKVASDFSKMPEALEAISTAKIIYLESDRANEYATWVRSLDSVSVTDVDLDNDTFEAAEKQYQKGNFPQAIISLDSYLSLFPKGIHILKAKFYLAEANYLIGSEAKAMPYYEYLVAELKNEYTEPALIRLSHILLKSKNIEKAIVILSRIETEGNLIQNKAFAQVNLMKCYYDKKQYSEAGIYAEKIIANPKTEAEIKGDAQIIIARLAIQGNNEVKAREAYEKASSAAQGELAAEVLYYDAYFKNKDGNFEKSNAVIQQMAKKYSGYKYYAAKGLILMANNFYKLKDSYQATYILESVIKNFTNQADIVSLARVELNTLKAEESKTNSSIKN